MYNKINSFINKNGLTVIHIPRPGISSVAISVRVIGGSIYEKDDEVGIAHFLEHIVLDGSKKYPSKKLISSIIEEEGGFRDAVTNKEKIEYTVKIIKDNVESAFEFLSEIIINPLISEEDIIKEKKIIEQEINRIKSDPEKYSDRFIFSGVFPDSRLGKLNTGDVEDIKKIQRDKVLSFHRRTHCARNMIISVCGDITEDEVRNLLNKYFKDLNEGERMEIVPLNNVPSKEIIIENINGIKQATLTVGYRSDLSNLDEYCALDLAYRVLMVGSYARLKYEIREKKALAYAVSGSNYRGRNYGIVNFRIGLDNESIKECISIIRSELSRISTELISNDELNKAFTLIKSAQIFNFENSISLASFYSEILATNGRLMSADEVLSKYKEISSNPEYVLEIAKRVFKTSPSILLMGSNISKDIAFL